MLKNIINNFFSFHFFLKTFNHLNKIKYFVQIGAHDGIMHDPLHKFLSKNEWSGILVEPQKDAFSLLTRPIPLPSWFIYRTIPFLFFSINFIDSFS